MIDNCDIFTNLHAIEPEVLFTTMTEITPFNLTQFTLSKLIPPKGE